MSEKTINQRPLDLAIKSNATVLITGPTGVGKTKLAREIHDQSSRSKGPFVSINLASLHEGTLESELFGHERGAFTGADNKRIGRIELADKGTLFLDEVGELSSRLQGRLLEFIQSKKITPVGGNSEKALDVRVIAATHKNLKEQIGLGQFREDLFHRLRVITIKIKPLMERVDELDEIIHNNLLDLCKIYDRKILKISETVATCFEKYTWPGNIRELRNVLESAVLACDDGEIKDQDLPDWFHEAFNGCETAMMSDHYSVLGTANIAILSNYRESLSCFEKEYLKILLKAHGSSLRNAAKVAMMSQATLYRRLKETGIIRENVYKPIGA